MNIKAKFCQIGWIVVTATIAGCGRDTSDIGPTLRPVDETATAASLLLDNALTQAASAQEVTQTAVTLSEQTAPSAPPVGVDVNPAISQADQVATLAYLFWKGIDAVSWVSNNHCKGAVI